MPAAVGMFSPQRVGYRLTGSMRRDAGNRSLDRQCGDAIRCRRGLRPLLDGIRPLERAGTNARVSR